MNLRISQRKCLSLQYSHINLCSLEEVYRNKTKERIDSTFDESVCLPCDAIVSKSRTFLNMLVIFSKEFITKFAEIIIKMI